MRTGVAAGGASVGPTGKVRNEANCGVREVESLVCEGETGSTQRHRDAGMGAEFGDTESMEDLVVGWRRTAYRELSTDQYKVARPEKLVGDCDLGEAT